MKAGWRTMKLNEILTDEQIDRVATFIKAEDNAGLRTYLNSLKPQLAAKEILPDFLYYSLLANLRGAL